MRDIHLAIRSARRRPFLAGIIVITLALGISLTTVVFSIADRVLFRELPYREPTRLVAVNTALSDRPDASSPIAAAVYTRLQEGVPSFAMLGAYRGAALIVSAPDGPISMPASAVTTNFFEVLGLRPMFGPGFTPTPVTQPPPSEIVLAHTTWQTTYGADPAIVGRSITVGGIPHTVVGVMPQNTVFPIATAEAWVPIDMTPFLANEERSRRQRWFGTVGRLAPGVRQEQAGSEVAVVAARLAQEYPMYHANERLTVTAFRDQIVGNFQPRVRILLGAGVLLLIIACANAASVLWAQVITRRGEFAVRAALGAGRPQLARQLTVEGLVLGAAGGLAGLALAPLFAFLLRPMTAPFLPAVGLPVIDLRVIGWAAATCVVCGIVLGLFPALFVGRGSLVEAIRTQGRSGGQGKADGSVRALLLVVQTSLCVALLVSAGLLIKSLTLLQRVDLGFDTSGMLTFDLNVPRSRYTSDEAIQQFYTRLEEELAAIPGVRSAGSASGLPMSGGTMASVGIMGRPAPDGQLPQSAYYSVADNYFEMMKVALRRGRHFDSRNAEPEAVINETMARQFWPAGDAVGARVHIGPVQTGPWITIVGVVADMRDLGPADSVRAIAFSSNRHFAFSGRGIMMRTTGDPSTYAPAVRRVVAQLDPSLPIMRLRPYDAIRRDDVLRERMSAMLLALFAAGALTLAVVGIYGLTAAFVAARVREFGIRIALGAQSHNVLGEAMRRGLRLTALGLGVGLLASAAMTRLFASVIHGVDPYDPAVYLGVSVVLGITSVLATLAPSRRATRVDPATALRSD